MRSFKIIPEKYIRQYSDYCKAMGRGTEQSLIYLSVFDNYCYKNWPGAESMTQEMVDTWCMQRPTEKNNSTRSRIYPVVSFLAYLRDRGLTGINAPDIPKAERSTYIPHAFTEEELLRFFQECDNYTVRQNSLRDKNLKLTIPVFFRLLYSSGIRTTEARLLKVTDVDLSSGVLSIHESKGNGQHFVVLHDTMLELMDRYDKAIHRLYPERTYFFPVNEEKGRSPVWVWKTFRTVWDRANKSHATAYQLRHNYATENINKWIDAGFDYYDKLVYLSRSMGHSSLESTRYYYSIVPAISKILDEKSGDGFDSMIPEVDYEESID